MSYSICISLETVLEINYNKEFKDWCKQYFKDDVSYNNKTETLDFKNDLDYQLFKYLMPLDITLSKSKRDYYSEYVLRDPNVLTNLYLREKVLI